MLYYEIGGENMIAVKAYYDGNAFVPLEKLSFKFQQQAIIVLDEEKTVKKNAKSCKGIASLYANPDLISREEEVAGCAFSGE